MTLIDRDREPSIRELNWFGVLFACFFGVLGGIAWWKSGVTTTSIVLWSIGFAVAAIYYAVQPLRRMIYFTWTALVFPIGWTISHLALAATYYLVLTPIGLAIRLVRDPMQRRFDRDAASYWTKHNPSADPARYFRQF